MMTSVFALASNGLTWGERASTAGIVTLQGMLTIFLVLSILWGAIEIMHRVVHKEKKVTPMEKIIEEFSLTAAYLPDLPENILITNKHVNRPGLSLAGFYDHFEQTRIELIGKAEHMYLQKFERIY